MKKKCFKCKQIKNLELFYKHSGMSDGHLGKCKYCTKKDVKERYYNPESRKKIIAYEKKRFQSPERKKKIKIYQEKRMLKFPGKYKAYNKTRYAIRVGRLIKEGCEICGDNKSQAHHKDYRKPLDVMWLCRKHHLEQHDKLSYI